MATRKPNKLVHHVHVLAVVLAGLVASAYCAGAPSLFDLEAQKQAGSSGGTPASSRSSAADTQPAGILVPAKVESAGRSASPPSQVYDSAASASRSSPVVHDPRESGT
jgi:hypothetical protein